VILPDVNILVHAFRSDCRHHEICRSFLDDVINGACPHDVTLWLLPSFIR